MSEAACVRCVGFGVIPDRESDGLVKCPRCLDGSRLGEQSLSAEELEIDRLRAEKARLLEFLSMLGSYLGHQDQDANHEWMFRKIQAAIRGEFGPNPEHQNLPAGTKLFVENRHLREAMQSIAHVTKSVSGDKVELFAQVGHVHKIATDTLARVAP